MSIWSWDAVNPQLYWTFGLMMIFFLIFLLRSDQIKSQEQRQKFRKLVIFPSFFLIFLCIGSLIMSGAYGYWKIVKTGVVDRVEYTGNKNEISIFFAGDAEEEFRCYCKIIYVWLRAS